ncbi:MAG: glycoside hydrolase family 127 protein [Bacteroidales bacterium]
MASNSFLKTAFLLIVFAFGLPLNAQTYVPEKENLKIKVKPEIKIQAYAFNLKDVKLLEGSAFKNAMDKDALYLLKIEPDRLLHRFRLNAGLAPKGQIYGGWESEGLSGHTLGHYLSACSMFYAGTGNPEFKEKVDYIVDELKICQDTRKTGYVGAIPNEDSIFIKVSKGIIKSSGFDLNGGWSPWYTVHKVMAGLVDAYLYCDNQKALEIVKGMADWTAKTIENLNKEELLKMLNCEYGGMNDVLANLYAITGHKKYLALADKFRDEFVMGKLAKKIDPMPGKHSNTNVPKAIGAARLYELTGNADDETIAAFFWETMVNHHSYVIGGNSNYEYCGEADKLNNRLSDNTCETCNTYNMLKLTRHLFSWNPDSKLMDYYERALYNHILASQNPENGMMCYFVPLRMGTIKQFSDEFNTFTCCVGSGMENHSKYTEAIYSQTSKGDLMVNLFIASELNWKDKAAKIRMETSFPEDSKVKLYLELSKPLNYKILIRDPKWANHKVKITVNGKEIATITNPDGYITLEKKWNNHDSIEIVLPMALYSESMPDNQNRVAFLYGPLVLAAQLGDSIPDPIIGTPVLLTNNRDINKWINKNENQTLTFKTNKVGEPFDFTLKPFFSTYNQYYSVYFDYFTEENWKLRQEEYLLEKKRQQEIELRTIDNFRIGEMQPERDHKLTASAQSYVDVALGRSGREARRGNYFEFEMKVKPGDQNLILLTYIGDDKDRKFDLLVNGNKLTTVEWPGGETGKFYDFEYPVSAELINGKSTVTIRIEANYGKTAGRIFGCRILSSKP